VRLPLPLHAGLEQLAAAAAAHHPGAILMFICLMRCLPAFLALPTLVCCRPRRLARAPVPVLAARLAATTARWALVHPLITAPGCILLPAARWVATVCSNADFVLTLPLFVPVAFAGWRCKWPQAGLEPAGRLQLADSKAADSRMHALLAGAVASLVLANGCPCSHQYAYDWPIKFVAPCLPACGCRMTVMMTAGRRMSTRQR
jgi:hypothetical protein